MILQVFNTPERRTLARAAEPRIARGAHLVRLDAKFNHALGEHGNKQHVLWFRPEGDDSVRGARLPVFWEAKACSDLPVRACSLHQLVFPVLFFCVLTIAAALEAPGSLPEAFPEAFSKIALE